MKTAYTATVDIFQGQIFSFYKLRLHDKFFRNLRPHNLKRNFLPDFFKVIFLAKAPYSWDYSHSIVVNVHLFHIFNFPYCHPNYRRIYLWPFGLQSLLMSCNQIQSPKYFCSFKIRNNGTNEQTSLISSKYYQSHLIFLQFQNKKQWNK